MSLAHASEPRDPSKAERVYRDLRRRIRELALAPGAPINKGEIALALGISRAPVSEAIARLADEGLIEVFPQHGSFVSPVRAADVRESLLIRTALETEVIRRVASDQPRHLAAELARNIQSQERALRDSDLARFYDFDEAMHAAIFVAAASPRAVRLLDTVRAPLDRVRRLALPVDGRPEATLAEHKRIADGIASGDPDLAAAAMRAHLSVVARTIESNLVMIEDEHA